VWVYFVGRCVCSPGLHVRHFAVLLCCFAGQFVAGLCCAAVSQANMQGVSAAVLLMAAVPRQQQSCHVLLGSYMLYCAAAAVRHRVAGFKQVVLLCSSRQAVMCAC
jgi:hypothetical protein